MRDSLGRTRELSEIVALEERTSAQLLRTLLRTFVVLTAAVALVGAGVGAGGYRQAALATLGAVVYGLLLAGLPRLGPRRTGVLCTVWYFTIAVAALGIGRGVHDVSMVLFPAGLVVGALLMPRRWLAALIGFTIAAVAAVGVAQALRLRSPESSGALAEVAVAVLLLLVAGVLTLQIVGTLRAALVERRHAERALEHQAYHDALTGLPNRASLHRELTALLARQGESPTRAGLVLLDLNRFREINDALGHDVGDLLLAEIGTRLDGSLAEARATFYRLGGDEFAALLPDVTGPGEAERLARQLLAELARPLDAAGAALEIGAAAGVAIYPDHGGSSHELLRCADVALYRAKRAGSAIATYAPEHDEHTPERLALVSELGQAIREGRLILHFQPTVALASGVAVGFEALVRWPHPRLGMLSAAEFLPLAEASDLIHPLTYWVVESALTQLRRWQVERPELTMAINLSVRNLLDSNCSKRLEEIIRRVGVDPGAVAFELTETAVMIDPEDAVTMLGRITATGARLAIDDFGTGYSSFTYLRRFPVHAIKIDRSFVADLEHGERSLAIVRSTVHLARGLGLQTIAEGVERPETARVLREAECELAQGYFFARPGPADEIGPLLRSSRWTLPA